MGRVSPEDLSHCRAAELTTARSLSLQWNAETTPTTSDQSESEAQSERLPIGHEVRCVQRAIHVKSSELL